MLTSFRAGRRAGTAVLAAVVLLLDLAGPAVASPTPQPPVIRGAGSSSAIAGHYIVVLKDTAAVRASGVAARSHALNDEHRGTLGHVYEHALHGFSAQMSEAEALKLAADPDVDYVEQDQMLYLADTQENPPSWGLDRIDQRARPVDQTYSYDLPAAANVTAYVIDTGIRITHSDFSGRASYGWDVTTNTPVAYDCWGHGTHVAGTIGGTAYGVAKAVHLVAVKVFGCTDGSPAETIIAGIDWVKAHAVKPAVVNISIGNSCLPSHPCDQKEIDSVKTAITDTINSGLTVVVSAGNDNVDACNGSYSRVPLAITVGATDINDTVAPYSNWGSCVNIWAPGGGRPPVNGCVPAGTPGYRGIWSDWFTSDTATCQISGSSMATAEVTGTVALILGRPGWAAATPAQISDELLNHMAISGAVTDPVAGHNSTTRMLYTAPPPKAGGSSIAVARNQDGRLDLFGVNGSGEMFFRSQNAVNVNDWSDWTKAEYTGWYAVAAQADGDNHIKLMGLRRASQDVWHRSQAFISSNAWWRWSSFPGLLNSVTVARSDSGYLELFGTNAGGQAWHSSQTAVGAATFTAWDPFNLGGGTVRSVAADTNANGLVEVFALTSAGQIFHRWQDSPTATTYTPWVVLDGSLASVAVARNKDNSIELFGVNSAGELFHRDAGLGTNNWFSWSQLDIPVAVGRLRSLAAETNADGRVELFAVNTVGQIWHRWQTSAGSGTYSAWTQLDGLLRP